MTAACDWTDVVSLLEEELNDPDSTLSIEESVIRASIKAIPANLQTEVTRLFRAFALVPEDTYVPLEVLGRIYDACGASVGGDKAVATGRAGKPISRLHVRQYLKVLLDRSLVLGTLDRPVHGIRKTLPIPRICSRTLMECFNPLRLLCPS